MFVLEREASVLSITFCKREGDTPLVCKIAGGSLAQVARFMFVAMVRGDGRPDLGRSVRLDVACLKVFAAHSRPHVRLRRELPTS